MKQTIGGPLRYDVLAQMHKPKTAEALCSEVRRLATTGLSPIDISAALRLDVAAVREMLIGTPGEMSQWCKEAWTR
jgi:hypothetical protein